MLSLILLISVTCLVVLLKKFDDYIFNNAALLCGGITVSALLSLVCGVLVIGISFAYADAFNVDKKIEIHKEENKKIEQDVSTIVNNYQNHENDTFKGIIDNPTVLAVVCPELKSNELVSKQIDLYIKNNQKIKDLKITKASKDVYEFLLYFG